MGKVMKKFSVALILVMLTVMLTGCVRGEMNVTIKRNGKMDVSVLIATEEPGNLDRLISAREINLRRQEGWKIDEYSQDGYSGYLCTKSNVDVLAGEVTPGFNLSDGLFSKNDETYVMDIDLYRGQDPTRIHNYLKEARRAGGKLTVTVTVPYPPEKYTATTVSDDGRTFSWDLLDDNTAGKVFVEYKAPGATLYVAYGVGGVLAVALLVFLVKRLRNKKQ